MIKINSKIMVVIIALVIGTALYLTTDKLNSSKRNIGQENVELRIRVDKSKSTKINNQPDILENVLNNQAEKLPADTSGQIISQELPWEKDEKFLQLKKKYNANIRMGAFKTVLPDPLPGEEENVSIAADKIAGTVILPGKVFSQNSTAGPYTREKGYKEGPTYSGGKLITTIGGGVCKIATTLYNVAILSNMKVVERHNHSMIVPYVPAGQDATVYYGSRDVKILNPYKWPVILWAKSEGKTLYMAIYGREMPPKITWHHETLNEKETYNIYKTNPSLPKGAQKLILEGYKGYTVKSWLTIEMPDGSVQTRNLGIDHYIPMPGIVEVGVGE